MCGYVRIKFDQLSRHVQAFPAKLNSNLFARVSVETWSKHKKTQPYKFY